MKLIKNKKYIIVVIFVVGIFVLLSSNVFGEVNKNYKGIDTVPDEYLEEAIEDSVILKLFAKLVYGAGRLIEWLLGIIFKLLTGTSDYPWADKIVFNAVPLLDVNFINPADGSFVGGNSGIKELLKNLYGTCFTIAATFFGIAVMVMAIKLVISTIASDKAKYKQAIVDWFIGLLLLFCMNYFISFIFYLNEQLVEVASGIVIDRLKGADNVVQNRIQVQIGEAVDEYINAVKEQNIELTITGVNGSTINKDVGDILSSNKGLLSTWMQLPASDTSHGLHEGILKKANEFARTRMG